MSLAIRDAYGNSLAKYGAMYPNVVALDADVSSSTKSGVFGKAYPERFFNVGIAEANMNAMACGMASAGKIPFVNTFATFITSNGLLSLRALASYSNLNVKVMGAYGGLSDAYDGPSHHSIDDLAIMAALPNFTVLVPSDEVITDWMVKTCIEREGPVYMRLSRDVMPVQYKEGEAFELGKAKTLREGEDISILACGVMVGKAMEAAETLAKEGISARVLDMFSIKPVDEDAIIQAATQTGGIVVAEEHNVYGGLCSIVASTLVRRQASCPVAFVALEDTHAETGGYAGLLQKYGLDASSIVKAVRKLR